LIDAAIQAYGSLRTTERPHQLLLWAIEKNPSAVQRLWSRSTYDPLWKDVVHVLAADLRHVTAQALGGQPADIVVSELLGSWGCNEVSPECLEGLWSTNAVHPHTVSIPTSYTSYLAPVSSVKLWQQARQRGLYPNPSETGTVGFTAAMETGYVVRPYDASQMASSQPCWTFTHPTQQKNNSNNESSNSSNNNLQQSVHLEFSTDSQAVVQGCGYGALDQGVAAALCDDETTTRTPTSSAFLSPLPWTLTGLLGTFTTVLYQRVNSTITTTNNNKEHTDIVYLSTCPTNFSVGMFSWFPLYLPLVTPLTVPSGATVHVQAWRRTRYDAVWYEWAASVWRGEECLSASPIHNPNGQSSSVTL
jgi:protein arginine N-methyltransferase 5